MASTGTITGFTNHHVGEYARVKMCFLPNPSSCFNEYPIAFLNAQFAVDFIESLSPDDSLPLTCTMFSR
jgi:hypothetical protein